MDSKAGKAASAALRHCSTACNPAAGVQLARSWHPMEISGMLGVCSATPRSSICNAAQQGLECSQVPPGRRTRRWRSPTQGVMHHPARCACRRDSGQSCISKVPQLAKRGWGRKLASGGEVEGPTRVQCSAESPGLRPVQSES